MRGIQETVYEHASDHSTFTVTAAESWSRAMVLRLKKKYPDEVEIVCENDDGSILAHFPLEWMRIVPKRRDTLTPEQKRAAAERLSHSRESNRKAGGGDFRANSDVHGFDRLGHTQDIQTAKQREEATK